MNQNLPASPATGLLWSAAGVTLPETWLIESATLRVERPDFPGSDDGLRDARTLAMSAFVAHRGLGVGLSGGPDAGRIHLAIQTADLTHGLSVEAPRQGAGWVGLAGRLIERLLVESDLEDLPGRSVRARSLDCRHPELPRLLREQVSHLGFDLIPDVGALAWTAPEPPRLLLPGSFRPVHEGHLAMARVASGRLGLDCAFELSIQNPDKPPLDYVAISERIAAFLGHSGRLFLTNAPRFIEKARIFPGATFVVGDDTARRLVDPRYSGSDAARDVMLDEFESLGTRFLVFGRPDADGRFRILAPADADSPRVARFLEASTDAVPEDVFRSDLSSTKVRQTMENAPS